VTGPAAEGDTALAQISASLADAIEASLAGWVTGCVERVVSAWVGAVPETVRAEAEIAGQAAAAEVGPVVRTLLLRDIDDQSGTPLAILRRAVAYPTAVLLGAGVPPVRRDDYSLERFPADIYDLTPANLADVDPALAELGLAWGAAKAWSHRRRHAGPAGGPSGSGG